VLGEPFEIGGITFKLVAGPSGGTRQPQPVLRPQRGGVPIALAILAAVAVLGIGGLVAALALSQQDEEGDRLTVTAPLDDAEVAQVRQAVGETPGSAFDVGLSDVLRSLPAGTRVSVRSSEPTELGEQRVTIELSEPGQTPASVSYLRYPRPSGGYSLIPVGHD
jgi:uncharacterized protein YfaS (alpha-2-macroglobulin family)